MHVMVFVVFAMKVKFWITFNEPLMFIYPGYGCGFFPPLVRGVLDAMFVVAHNVIRAHALVWHTYDQDFRPTQAGLCCILMFYSFIWSFAYLLG